MCFDMTRPVNITFSRQGKKGGNTIYIQNVINLKLPYFLLLTDSLEHFKTKILYKNVEAINIVIYKAILKKLI